MNRSPSIERLLDEAAWLRRLAAELVADSARADDLVQETWVAALRRPPAADIAPRRWLARVARNVAANMRRAETRRTDHEGRAREAGLDSSPAALAQMVETQRVLVEAVAQLAEPLRAVIVLRYFKELDSDAIGRELGLSPSAVRTRMQKALEELRAELDRKFEGGRGAWGACFVRLIDGGEMGTSVAPAASAAHGSFWMASLVAGLCVVVAMSVGSWKWVVSSRAVPASFVRATIRPVAATGSIPEAKPDATAHETSVSREPLESVELGETKPDVADSLSGTVLVDGNVPPAPLQMELSRGISVPYSYRFLHCAANGAFAFTELGPHWSGSLTVPGFEFENGLVALSFQAPTTGVVVRLKSNPTLTGRFLEPAKLQPIPVLPFMGPGEYSLHGLAEGVETLLSGGSFRTDDEGRFRLALTDDVEAERISLLIEVPDVGRKVVHVPDFPRAAGCDIGDVVLDAARSVPFRIVDADAHPIPGAGVTHEDWRTWAGVDEHGAGVIPCVEIDGAPMRFGAQRYIDQVLVVRAGDSPTVLLEPTNVLAIRVVSIDGAALPALHLVVADYKRLFLDAHGMWPNALGERVASYSYSTTSYLVNYEAGSHGELLLRDLKPDLPFCVEVRDLSDRTLATRTCSVGAGEWQELTIPITP